jgi:hypothetical protein
MSNRTRLACAGAIALAGIPVGVALAAGPPPTETATIPATALHASIGGHRTVADALATVRHARLVAGHARLARRVAALGGPRPDLVAARSLGDARLRAANAGLRARIRDLDVEIPPILERIAACESGGDPRAIGGGGLYRGKYQFMAGTWEAVGGSGDPAAAPEAEQDRRAAILLQRSGPGQWPVCSR